MSTVYLARDQAADETSVAVKILNTNARQHFARCQEGSADGPTDCLEAKWQTQRVENLLGARFRNKCRLGIVAWGEA